MTSCPTCGAIRRTPAGAAVCSDAWHAEPVELKLNDKGRGYIWLTLRDGIVVGAMGSDPKRYIGLTEARARHIARYGGE